MSPSLEIDTINIIMNSSEQQQHQQALSDSFQQYLLQQQQQQQNSNTNSHHHDSASSHLLDHADSFSDLFNEPPSSSQQQQQHSLQNYQGGNSNNWNNNSSSNNNDIMAQYQSLLAMQQQQQQMATTNQSNTSSGASTGQITPATIGSKQQQQHNGNTTSTSRLFLDSKVEPFSQRSSGGGGGSTYSKHSSSDDVDLLKYFDNSNAFDDVEPLKVAFGNTNNNYSQQQQQMNSQQAVLQQSMLAAQSMSLQQQQQQQQGNNNMSAQQQQQQQQQQERLKEQMRQQQERHKALKKNFEKTQAQHRQQQKKQQKAAEQAQAQQRAAAAAAAQAAAASSQQQQLEDNDEPFSLPSTMVPPSVLASMYVNFDSKSSSAAPHKANAGRISKPSYKKVHSKSGGNSNTNAKQSPQEFFNELLHARGYQHVPRIKSDDTGYECVPSALQLASFGTHLVKAIHTNDSVLLSQLLECGLSPNPCNQFRDSIVDLVCKRGNADSFACLVEHGADLQVVDGFGRCPLHHAAWASSFCRPIVELILEKDPIQMFLEDKHGQTPLEYITRHHLFDDWKDFLEEMADTYWPRGGHPNPASLLQSPRERRPDGTLCDPPNALSVSLAAMVSAGTMSVQEVMAMDAEQRQHFSNNRGGKK